MIGKELVSGTFLNIGEKQSRSPMSGTLLLRGDDP